MSGRGERRRAARRPVAWLVRLWLNDRSSIGGRAADASTHGMWVFMNWLPTGTLKLDRAYRVEVRIETGETLWYTAALRRSSQLGIGLEVTEHLPGLATS